MPYKDPAKQKEWVKKNRDWIRAYHCSWEKKARLEGKIKDNTPAKQAAKKRYKLRHPGRVKLQEARRYIMKNDHIKMNNRINARLQLRTKKLQRVLDKISKEMGIYDE